MQKTVIVLNSAIHLADDIADQPKQPGELWARIAPASGEKSAATAKGDLVNQRFSPESNARVVANFAPEVLVDREHNSILTGDTTAYAWISKIKADADGLHACFNTTDVGWDALRNRRLRFPSAVFELDEQGYPQRLLSVGLTNRHNLKDLAPILNKEPGAQTEAAPNAASTDASATPTPTQGEQHVDKELLTLLGLAENADAPAVLAKVKTLVASLDAMKAKMADAEEAAMNKEADDFVKANAAKIKDHQKVKAQYVLNKDATIELFSAVAEPEKKTHQVLNREDGKAPDAQVVLNAEAAKTLAINKAVDEAHSKYRCASRAAAWELAQRDHPELFNP